MIVCQPLYAFMLSVHIPQLLPGVRVLATCTGLINLAYHDGRIADCALVFSTGERKAESILMESASSLQTVQVSIHYFARYHYVLNCAIGHFESDPHVCHLEISCFLQTISCLASLLSFSKGCATTDLSYVCFSWFYNQETNQVNGGVAKPLPILARQHDFPHPLRVLLSCI